MNFKSIYKLGSPPLSYRLCIALEPWFLISSILLFVVGMYSGLFVAPPDDEMGDAFRIIYFHVPSAYVSMMAYVCMAIAAIIGLTYKDLNSICKSISNEGSLVELANINSSNQIVISGTKDAIDIAIERSTAAGAKRAVLLPMSVPAHCKLMKPASEKFKVVLNSINMQEPKCKVIQNVDASITNDVLRISENLTSQIHSPVRWTDIMDSFNELKLGTYIECGPGKVLSGLMKRALKDTQIVSLDNYETFLNKENLT